MEGQSSGSSQIADMLLIRPSVMAAIAITARLSSATAVIGGFCVEGASVESKTHLSACFLKGRLRNVEDNVIFYSFRFF